MAKKEKVAKEQARMEAKPPEEVKKVADVKKVIEVKKVAEVKKAPIVKKVPKEKTVKVEAGFKKLSQVEGQSRRARHLHSLLDDLIKNREDVLDTIMLPENPVNTTLEKR
jgi:hypothetical protein